MNSNILQGSLCRALNYKLYGNTMASLCAFPLTQLHHIVFPIDKDNNDSLDSSELKELMLHMFEVAKVIHPWVG